jgi:hypothetical protein
LKKEIKNKEISNVFSFSYYTSQTIEETLDENENEIENEVSQEVVSEENENSDDVNSVRRRSTRIS